MTILPPQLAKSQPRETTPISGEKWEAHVAVLPIEVVAAAKRGWRIFPIVAGGKKPCILRWQIVATCDLGQLEIWAKQFPRCNWAVATGAGSGVFVLDVDGAKGRASLAELEAKHGPLPITLSSRTGREEGGVHHWLKCPSDFAVRTSVGRLGVGHDVGGSGLDIKGEGGFALIPPSLHPSGRQYRFDNAKTEPDSSPEWLLEKLRALAQSAPPTGYEIGALYEGTRNDALYRQACAMRRRGASEFQILTELRARNLRCCRPPLLDEEIRGLAANAAKYEPGGPDYLESAWLAAEKEMPAATGYLKFMAIVRHLQRSRAGLPIALPVKRIGILMNCDWTQVRRWTRRATNSGTLRKIASCVPHRRANLYTLVVGPSGTYH